MSLSYETALKLKENGYPQTGTEGVFMGDISKEETLVYIPTLEELIEACGNKYFKLTHYIHKWEALYGHDTSASGSTPREAVAALWLAVNGK